jgi:hypothetical protein
MSALSIELFLKGIYSQALKAFMRHRGEYSRLSGLKYCLLQSRTCPCRTGTMLRSCTTPQSPKTFAENLDSQVPKHPTPVIMISFCFPRRVQCSEMHQPPPFSGLNMQRIRFVPKSASTPSSLDPGRPLSARYNPISSTYSGVVSAHAPQPVVLERASHQLSAQSSPRYLIFLCFQGGPHWWQAEAVYH